MVDVLPAKNPFALAGLVLCAQITAGGMDPGVDDDEEDAGPCVDVTAEPGGAGPCVEATASPEKFARPAVDLALLRQQLREALAQQAAGNL